MHEMDESKLALSWNRMNVTHCPWFGSNPSEESLLLPCFIRGV